MEQTPADARAAPSASAPNDIDRPAGADGPAGAGARRPRNPATVRGGALARSVRALLRAFAAALSLAHVHMRMGDAGSAALMMKVLIGRPRSPTKVSISSLKDLERARVEVGHIVVDPLL
eukprot:scaffold5223_cov104-Isochrysis_galbana.AAC.7